MSEVKKCLKCGGEMKNAKIGDLRGDRALAFYCKNCGFIELYKEMKGKKE
jgi:predicted nucleic-acid-binding Zn-ribbon protein